MMDMIEPKSVLAITATAGPRVVSDICRTLQIENNSHTPGHAVQNLSPSSEGVKISKTDRDNIDVSCLLLDTQEERIGKLLKILSRNQPARNEKKAKQSDELDGRLATGSVIVCE